MFYKTNIIPHFYIEFILNKINKNIYGQSVEMP